MSKKWGGQPGAAPSNVFGPDARVWCDGELIAAADATTGLLTHTLHYGFGLFEGIRAYRQKDGSSAVFRLEDHIDRMFAGARILDMTIPFAAEDLVRACVETLVANKLAEAYLRPLAYVGQGRMGIYAPDNPVRVMVAAWEWGAYLGEEGLQHGIRCRVSSFTRTHVNTNMVRAKVTGGYVTSILAKSEAVNDGYDEAILLDQDGYCAEGSGENLFIVKDGTLVTPPLSSPILAGLTRAAVLTLAAEHGVPVRQERFSRDELYLADEAFFTGTAAEVTPIREVDHRTIGSGRPGPITAQLQDAFFKVLRGEETRHAAWRHVYRV